MPIPRQVVLELQVPILTGGMFTARADAAQNFTLIVIYRGLHCPLCQKYLRDLAGLQADFEQRGIKLIAISGDTQERAQAMSEQLQAPDLRIGYALPLAAAREWGIFISSSRGKTSIGIDEPALYTEPAIFIVRADGTLFYSAVQTMPFARPHFDELLEALDFALAKGYPARGEYDGPL